MALSEFCTDEDIINNLRSLFDPEEQFDTDFQMIFNMITDRGLDFYLVFRGRRFSIDKITGAVSEIGGDVE